MHIKSHNWRDISLQTTNVNHIIILEGWPKSQEFIICQTQISVQNIVSTHLVDVKIFPWISTKTFLLVVLIENSGPKSVGFILWGSWMFIPHFMEIHLIVQSGSRWWTDWHCIHQTKLLVWQNICTINTGLKKPDPTVKVSTDWRTAMMIWPFNQWRDVIFCPHMGWIDAIQIIYRWRLKTEM